MASLSELLDVVNCTIRFKAPEGEYEGIVQEIFPTPEIVIVRKVILLPDRLMGCLNFRFSELANVRVISRPDLKKEKSDKKKDMLPVYSKTATERLFDLDGSSDIEDDITVEYQMKLVGHLSKFVPRDFAVIDVFNEEFYLSIKHIKKQQAIGVSLEGVKISRSGTLTWLCISTPCCNFLFDILALGEQAFRKGLKSILENAKIQKIFHDSRLASDCLYHKYGVRLVNVFDTQVADFIVMMQIVEKDKIDSRVNTLDACLSYYLDVPDNNLYGPANFDEDEDSFNFHALRPLKHEIQDVLINNVMYLHLLKRELELALQTPLRRATDVYLNSIQKLNEKELLLVPHKPDELPLDIHLEGIQIFRYHDFQYLCSMTASGPPYREIRNPIKSYLNSRAEYKKGQRNDQDSVVNQHANINNCITSLEMNSKPSVGFQKCGSRVKAYCNSGSSTKQNQESSDIANESSINRHTTKCNVDKYEALQLHESSNTKNSLKCGLVEHFSKDRESVKTTVDEASRSCSQITAATVHVNTESVVKDSSRIIESSNLRSCNQDNENVSKSAKLQIPQHGKKSHSELLELFSKMRSKNTSNKSDENSAKMGIATSTSTGKGGIAELRGISMAELLQKNHSVMKKVDDVSDSDLKKIEARVRTRHLQRDNSSMLNPFYRSSEDKSVKEVKNFAKEEDSTSEEVTIYYSETLDKPSQFVVKVNHKRTRLADLYRKAGDMSLYYTDEGSENSKTSSSQSNECVDSDDIWAALRKDCPPIDEKVRARLIPAGMSGY